jgi:hypothetical protein
VGRFNTRARSRYFAVVWLGTAVGVPDVDGVGVDETEFVDSGIDGRSDDLSSLPPQAASGQAATWSRKRTRRPAAGPENGPWRGTGLTLQTV